MVRLPSVTVWSGSGQILVLVTRPEGTSINAALIPVIQNVLYSFTFALALGSFASTATAIVSLVPEMLLQVFFDWPVTHIIFEVHKFIVALDLHHTSEKPQLKK